MAKLNCLMAIMPDGSGLTVKVRGDKIIVDIREIHNYFEEEWEGPMFEVYEKVFSQEFDLTGLSWKPKINAEPLAKWVCGRIKKSAFQKFAWQIVRLAQRIAEMNGEEKQDAA